MSDNKWTPEPWPEYMIIQNRHVGGIRREFPGYTIIHRDNYERARECVNALAGVENPKEYIETILKQREELAEQVKKLTAIITEHINRNV